MAGAGEHDQAKLLCTRKFIGQDRDGEGEKRAPTSTISQGVGSTGNTEEQQKTDAASVKVDSLGGKGDQANDGSSSAGSHNTDKEGGAAGGFLNELLSTSYQPKV
eukprot:1155473-Pelagomonas_calceolata.AAC.3